MRNFPYQVTQDWKADNTECWPRGNHRSLTAAGVGGGAFWHPVGKIGNINPWKCPLSAKKIPTSAQNCVSEKLTAHWELVVTQMPPWARVRSGFLGPTTSWRGRPLPQSGHTGSLENHRAGVRTSTLHTSLQKSQRWGYVTKLQGNSHNKAPLECLKFIHIR